MENSIDLSSPELFLNREISLLEFNWRVLQQALDPNVPLLERLNYLCISSTNLDEFFEVRVAGLIQQLEIGDPYLEADQISAQEVLRLISARAHELVEEQYTVLNEVLLPELEVQGIRVLPRAMWTEQHNAWLEKYFQEEILPILSPIGLDSAHPFPRLLNKSLNFIVSLVGKDAFGRDRGYAILQAPRALPRVIQLPAELSDSGQYHFVFLSSIIHAFAEDLFFGMKVKGCYQFRVTRNSDLAIDTEETSDLLATIADELTHRNYGDEVRLEIAHNCPEDMVNFLREQCGMHQDNVYLVNGPVNLSRIQALHSLVERPDMKFKPFTQGRARGMTSDADLFASIKKHDHLLHHPFESFGPIVDLIKQAAADSSVLAIKQTLYRTGASSPIVDALVAAAHAGKEVTVVVELRARFDEEANVALAAKLQEAGAHVVYGIVGYKTHAKMLLILRRENNKLRRYVHLGTGNYHRSTSRVYTDYGLLTSDKQIGEDVNNLFIQLTSLGKVPGMHKLLHAPFTLHERLLNKIDREIDHAIQGKPARIIIKVNSVVEPEMVQAFYRASMAGVRVDLIVRGICTLKPGVEGISDNIHVRSIIGRFLEHTRVYYFENDGQPEVWCASADLMKRNLLRRVETAFPVESNKLRQRIIEDLLLYLADNSQAWILSQDGRYKRADTPEDGEKIAAQSRLLEQMAAQF
ncbi:Polyphosphate kinase [Methylophaga frappieri]|uniref:Polyphosphate kinase n=1 Tax=Methylophaga frappieri (strain ATCC BAA-2434 / DSM 25690 / JAM7) TaxID=754477 RepID=I1YE68_METFJ|nr:polyphosphate kinase 1 [Methylophaga frappieri]AFJ01211.1 Polyphosphate kinase [Methylophaga frappieri]